MRSPLAFPLASAPFSSSLGFFSAGSAAGGGGEDAGGGEPAPAAAEGEGAGGRFWAGIGAAASAGRGRVERRREAGGLACAGAWGRAGMVGRHGVAFSSAPGAPLRLRGGSQVEVGSRARARARIAYPDSCPEVIVGCPNEAVPAKLHRPSGKSSIPRQRAPRSSPVEYTRKRQFKLLSTSNVRARSVMSPATGEMTCPVTSTRSLISHRSKL